MFIFEFVIKYFIFFKNKIKGFYVAGKALYKLTKDEVYFDSHDKETPREVTKTLKAYFSTKFSFKDFFKKYILNLRLSYPYIGVVIEYIFKYLLVFIFILWILFESFFFRFYLVDTPLDTKIDPSRKEGGKKRRFIPVVAFETLSFYHRPFWRIFNNLMVFISNLGAIGFLIYYVYILDLFAFFKFILNWLLSFGILILSFVHILFKVVNRNIKQLFFVCLLFYWRIYFFFFNFFSTLNYIILLPFILVYNILHCIFFGIQRLRFFLFLADFKELKNLYKKLTNNRKKGGYKSVYHFVFEICIFLEYFVTYFYIKLCAYDLIMRAKNHQEFKNKFFFTEWLKKTYFFKILKAFFLLSKWVYIFLCYIVILFVIGVLFMNYIYFPFFS